MSEIYIAIEGSALRWRETDEPAARQVARQAITERERERTKRRLRRLRAWTVFWLGFAVGAWAAALLGGL